MTDETKIQQRWFKDEYFGITPKEHQNIDTALKFGFHKMNKAIKKAKEEVLDYFVSIHLITPKEAKEVLKRLRGENGNTK